LKILPTSSESRIIIGTLCLPLLRERWDIWRFALDIDDERIREAVARTEIIRLPRQKLSTFGTTNIYYYLVTEPAYAIPVQDVSETVVREGRVIAERPRIVTPYYLSSLEGFSTDARRYFEYLVKTRGANAPGLFYAYRNEPKELNIISESLLAVVDKLKDKIDQSGDPLTAIIRGIDELWDVALIRFIYEMTSRSLGDNLNQLGSRGLLGVDRKGVPAEARQRIDELFLQVIRSELDPKQLKEELDRWGLFEEYEDRFFSLFGK
jgi:hypothetical protein